MDSSVRGPLWFILILFTLPRLSCDTGCPSGCRCMLSTSVMCAGYTITDIPSDLPSCTNMLLLDHTNMTVINEKSMADKDCLLRFALTQSHLHTIHPQAFVVAPQLKSVKLSSNDISMLPARVFRPLTSLEQLFLDGNKLEKISQEMFDGLVGLQHLDLSRNKLASLPSDVFDGLTNLTEMNLGRNSIKKLPTNIFHSLTKLCYLSIYNNELEVLETEMFDDLTNLMELKLHHNQIASLPPQVFRSLINLEILTLSSNYLQTVPEKSFYHMPKMTKLTLYNNPLKSLPGKLMGHMPYIREFHLYNTDLVTVPENVFANMSGLLSLNFHVNRKLRELPSGLFCCLPHLKMLSLQSNDLHYLHPQLFSNLTALDLLFLNDNKLQNLPEDIFQGLGNLSTIDLKNNHLENLPEDIFLTNTLLRSLNLSMNIWDCTCSIRGIVRWLRQNQHVVAEKEGAICVRPLYQMLRTIVSLHDEEFSFCDPTTTAVVASTSSTSFPLQTGTQEATRPSHATSTSGPRPDSTTSPPGITSTTTTQRVTQQVTIQTTTKPANATTSDATRWSTSLHTVATTLPYEDVVIAAENLPVYYESPPFYDVLVIEQGPQFIHHNFHRSYVCVWFLPSDPSLVGFFMVCHVLLVATGLFLILAAMYSMHRLSKIMNTLLIRRGA